MIAYDRVMARTRREGDCLVWTGGTTFDGYGRVHDSGKARRVHRIVFEHHQGPTPLDVLHRCDNRRCVEIDHLRAGTKLDNARDSHERGRVATKKNGRWRGGRGHRVGLQSRERGGYLR